MVKKVNSTNTTNISDLVKKNHTKINQIREKSTDNDRGTKYITNQEFNKSKWKYFSARLVEVNLASKNDIANFVKMTDFNDKLKKLNKKVTVNKTRYIEVKAKLDHL